MSNPESRSAATTVRTLIRQARDGQRFACLTCYDATTARWLDRAGVEVLLVGDSAAEVILGLPGTIHAPLDFMVTLTAAVKRGAPGRVVMADMPFMSYQANEDQALHNAARFMTEGMADCVKVEVDRSWAPLVSRMSRAGIPAVAHIGCRPQQSKMHGGTFAVGKTAEQALQVIHDAAALEAAGATMLLLEACPSDVAAKVVERATIPVIGCGAGPTCHGQVLVLQDLLGMSAWQPSFARPEVQLGEATRDAAAAWCERVRQGHVESAFRMADGEGARLEALLTGAAHAKA